MGVTIAAGVTNRSIGYTGFVPAFNLLLRPFRIAADASGVVLLNAWRYGSAMGIVDFKCRKTAKTWRGEVSAKLPSSILQNALRKLFMLARAVA